MQITHWGVLNTGGRLLRPRRIEGGCERSKKPERAEENANPPRCGVGVQVRGDWVFARGETEPERMGPGEPESAETQLDKQVYPKYGPSSA